MKKMLKIMFALSLNVVPSSIIQSYTRVDDNKFKKFLQENNIDLYFKFDLSFKNNVSGFIYKNIENILKVNLEDYDWDPSVLDHLDIDILKYEDYKLTLNFKDKEGISFLHEQINKEFDLFLYNYDNFSTLQKELDKHDFNLKDLDFTFKDTFNQLCSEYIYFNGEHDFYDYLDFEYISDESDTLVSNFLGSNQIYVKIKDTK
ncbi:hypothetical protein [Spiroplasma culicicola]|uniref:Uncharacterized protein n=1 Tax=Spiroplasma culicicola AES-1 TaxID=1276246 RepID=W6A853_9MOLU|nr:hypothetical protein [Spiroplasma culicicola]AHI53167.1 hypothetical protein SCULI_v1c08270 [Spiroplasma culicicola AES-1]